MKGRKDEKTKAEIINYSFHFAPLVNLKILIQTKKGKGKNH
jgi:hypothetical protein